MNRLGALFALVLAAALLGPIPLTFAAPPGVNQGPNGISLTSPDQLNGRLAPLAWSDAAIAKAEQYQSALQAGKRLAFPLTDAADPWVIPGARQYDFARAVQAKPVTIAGASALGDQTYLTPASTIGVP